MSIFIIFPPSFKLCVTLFLFVTLFSHTLSCSCYSSPLEQRVCRSNLTVRATVLATTDTCGPGRVCNAMKASDSFDGYAVILARVVSTYHGKAPKHNVLFLLTALNDGMCGVLLMEGLDYIFTLAAPRVHKLPSAPTPYPSWEIGPSPIPSSVEMKMNVREDVATEGQGEQCKFLWDSFSVSVCDFPTEWMMLTPDEVANLDRVRDGGVSMCSSLGVVGKKME